MEGSVWILASASTAPSSEEESVVERAYSLSFPALDFVPALNLQYQFCYLLSSL